MAGKFVSPKAKESLMTDILVKLFVKDYKDVEKVSVRTAYGVLASGVGIFCNVLLTIAKMVIGILLHSVSVTADAFNNLSDAGSSIIGMIGVKMAEKPADKEQKAAIADAVKNVRRAIKSRDPAQMVSSADVLEQLLSQAGVDMNAQDNFQGSYENPNDSFEDDAMDADFESVDD